MKLLFFQQLHKKKNVLLKQFKTYKIKKNYNLKVFEKCIF